MCEPADEDFAPYPPPFHSRGYPCAFPPSMTERMLQIFDAASPEESSYTELVFGTTTEVGVAFEAVVGVGKEAEVTQQMIMIHFGLNERQLPLLQFGPGLKGEGPLFVQNGVP